jgi:arylsulfatase A-like enzyme
VKTIIRGAVHGAAFGLAVACFEMWFGVQRTMALRLPPAPFNLAKAASLEILLAVALGVLAAPLLRLRRGAFLHALTLAAAWLALERVVATDPAKVQMWVGPSVGALVLLGLGAFVARWSRSVAWGAGIAVLSAAVVVPVIVDRQRVDAMAHPNDASSTEASAAAGRAEPRPDVLVIVLDTVRAQSTSAYGYRRRTTPYLETLAKEGALFLDATAPSTWSLPAHASLFTGRFPTAHKADQEHRMLEGAEPTLAELLARNGYETRCFTANPHISDAFGLTRGFQWSDRAYLGASASRGFFFIYRALDLLGVSAEDKGGADVAHNFESWAQSRKANGRPTFAFINFLEAHFPYHQVPHEFLTPFTQRSPQELRSVSLEVLGAQFGRSMQPAEIEAATAPSIDMYDAGVLYSDHLLSRAVEALRKAGTLDNTVVVVLADPGEMVGEPGQFGPGAGLYEPGIRVPLLIRFPARVRAGARVQQPVSTAGIYATILDLVGIEIPEHVQVKSLIPALDGKPAGAPVIAERFAYPEEEGGGSDALAMRDRRYRVYRSGMKKLVQTSHGEKFLFDLVADAVEQQNLASSQPAELARMEAELDAWVKALGLPPLDAPLDFKAVPNVDAATNERLKELGYVE